MYDRVLRRLQLILNFEKEGIKDEEDVKPKFVNFVFSTNQAYKLFIGDFENFGGS